MALQTPHVSDTQTMHHVTTRPVAKHPYDQRTNLRRAMASVQALFVEATGPLWAHPSRELTRAEFVQLERARIGVIELSEIAAGSPGATEELERWCRGKIEALLIPFPHGAGQSSATEHLKLVCNLQLGRIDQHPSRDTAAYDAMVQKSVEADRIAAELAAEKLAKAQKKPGSNTSASDAIDAELN